MRGDVVRGGADVVIAEHRHRVVAGDPDQVEFGVQHGDEGPLTADERLGQVEPVLRQEGVQVVAGDPPGDVRETVAHLLPVAPDDLAQAPVDLRPAPAGAEDPVELVVRGGADPETGSVVGQDLEAAHVVHGLAVGLGRGATGVVADHAAQGTVAVGGGFGAELEFVRGEQPVELVEHDSGFDHTGPALGVGPDHAVAVLRPVDDDSGVGTLPSQAGPAAAGEDRYTEPRAHPDGRRTGVDAAGNDHPERDLAVVGAVGGVGAETPPVESHLRVHVPTEFSSKS